MSSPRSVAALTTSGAPAASESRSSVRATDAFAVGSASIPPSGQSRMSRSSPISGAVASSWACSTAYRSRSSK